MSVAVACPDLSILHNLALGLLSPAEVENLSRHCEECPRCVQSFHGIKTEDTLIEAMAAQMTVADWVPDRSVAALIERLQALPAPTAAATVEKLTAGSAPVTSPVAAAAETVVRETPACGDSPSGQGPGAMGQLGGYRILKVLGKGGMGIVYQAEDIQLQRPIALKVMKPDIALIPSARERFLREARAAAKLKSDHVVTIHRVGEERDVPFFAMELLEGLSLHSWLEKGRQPTLAQAARIGREIALGLADAHANGLIHRDVKPGNIWLDSRQKGRVKLLDFGLVHVATRESLVTDPGAILGTPAYMAPERSCPFSAQGRTA